MTVDEIASTYVHYKFEKYKLTKESERLKLLLKLNMASGPVYIICLLRIIAIEKEIFVLEIERGTEVKIPRLLSVYQYPHSFRFYDAIINIIKD